MYCVAATNDAPTLRACDIVTVQLVLAPEHAPDQPANVEPAAAAALRVTRVLALKAALQVEPQLMPTGALVTMPAPLTATCSP